MKVIKRLVEIMKSSLEQVAFIDQDECLLFLGRSIETVKNAINDETILHHTRHFLQRQCLPHIGTRSDTNRKKIAFLCCMARRLMLTSCGILPEDDRDHYALKRVDLTGNLLLALFKDRFKHHYIETAKVLLKKKIAGKYRGNNQHYRMLEMIFDHSTITNAMRSAMRTGNWGRLRGQPPRSGVTQTVSR